MSEPLTIWSCSICGPHKGNRSTWCDGGCGSDYNEMVPYVLRAELDRYRALVDAAKAHHQSVPNPAFTGDICRCHTPNCPERKALAALTEGDR